MSELADFTHELRDAEARLLHELRHRRRAQRQKETVDDELTVGQKVADAVAAGMGSWAFILIQSGILLLWIVANVTAWINHWDPYPFILLNLALSFQAAYAAPFIMMSQNRQQDIDRKAAEHDYQVNVKAELEIELLHQKMDQLRETEILNLTESIRNLTRLLEDKNTPSVAQNSAPVNQE